MNGDDEGSAWGTRRTQDSLQGAWLFTATNRNGPQPYNPNPNPYRITLTQSLIKREEGPYSEGGVLISLS